MNLQQERIQLACETLKLESLHSEWSAIADHCAGNDHTYADFLERLLQVEVEARSQRSRETLLKFAGFPGRKLIEDYDFKFATGAPRKLITELSGLAFVDRAENVVLIGLSIAATMEPFRVRRNGATGCSP